MHQVCPEQWKYSSKASKAKGQIKEHLIGTQALLIMLIYVATLTQQSPDCNTNAMLLLQKCVVLALSAPLAPQVVQLTLQTVDRPGDVVGVTNASGTFGAGGFSLLPLMDACPSLAAVWQELHTVVFCSFLVQSDPQSATLMDILLVACWSRTHNNPKAASSLWNVFGKGAVTTVIHWISTRLEVAVRCAAMEPSSQAHSALGIQSMPPLTVRGIKHRTEWGGGGGGVCGCGGGGGWVV